MHLKCCLFTDMINIASITSKRCILLPVFTCLAYVLMVCVNYNMPCEVASCRHKLHDLSQGMTVLWIMTPVRVMSLSHMHSTSSHQSDSNVIDVIGMSNIHCSLERIAWVPFTDINNLNHSIIRCGTRLLIHSQTSTGSRFGRTGNFILHFNGDVITYLC